MSIAGQAHRFMVWRELQKTPLPYVAQIADTIGISESYVRNILAAAGWQAGVYLAEHRCTGAIGDGHRAAVDRLMDERPRFMERREE